MIELSPTSPNPSSNPSPNPTRQVACLIALGANLGDRQSTLDEAIDQLRLHPEITLLRSSRWYRYPAVGGPGDQDDFFNGAAAISTTLAPDELVRELHRIEQAAGRIREQRWQARTLDCDLLLYGDQTIETPELQVPHPRMITRRFVLEPVAEIAGDWIHPATAWSMAEHLQHLSYRPAYFVVTGPDRPRNAALARAIQSHVGGSLWHEPVTQASSLPSEPIIGDCWLGESVWRETNGQTEHADDFELSDVEQTEKDAESFAARCRLPKLLLVAARPDSAFAKWLESLPREMRSPSIYLSAGDADAIQDGIGAVLAME